VAERATAVVLPLRLETVLRPRAGGTTLLVLVAPDVPWFDRHDPRVTKEELDDVQAYWAAGGGQLRLESFRELVRVHGGPRAAWLVRTFPAGFARSSARLRPRGAKPQFPRIPVFPRQLEIWIGRKDAQPALAKRQPVKVERLVLDPTLPRDKRWWSDWKQAKEVGLGFEIDLGAADPDDIDVIYAVGIDNRVGPAKLFTAHAAAGRLAIVPLGAPTNAVGASPAIDLGGSAEEWLKVASEGGDGGLGRHLGDRRPLPPVLGFDLPQRTDQLLVAALWSALWGRVAQDVWQLGDGVRDAGAWAQRHLAPEGPLPTIRIDDQPYGLLPATALRHWRPAPGDPPVESTLRGTLMRLRDVAARAAARRGTVAGADPRRFLDLVGDTPLSHGYSVRWFLSLEVLQILERVYGIAVELELLEKWWQTTAELPLTFVPDPARRYATLGVAQELAIPLVEPLHFPGRGSVPLADLIDTLAREARDAPGRLLVPSRVFSDFHQFASGISREELDAPDSLLIRLMLHSFIVAAARANLPDQGPSLLDEPVMPASEATALANALTSGDPWIASGPAADVLARTLDATRTLAQAERRHGSATIETAFRAVLDTASHRVDPWITGIAWRRLRTLQGQGKLPGLGAYGWVDGPLVGRSGPTEGGLLHAPSDHQARTAVVLRDKAISSPDDKWNLTLRSRTVRAARQLAEEVRLGAHPAETVGRMVERAVEARARVAVVRDKFPAAGDEHRRRTCDGLAAVAAGADLSFLTAAERERIEELRAVLDAYADLLVADAVHKVVGGRIDLARPAMEAAAGMTTPPELEVLRTPRRGRTATTSVLAVLPVPTGAAGGRPAKIADAAVTAFVDAAAAGTALWTWQLADGPRARVRLDELGLAPADTLALAPDALDRLAVAAAGGGHVTKAPAGPARATAATAVVAGAPDRPQAGAADLRRRLAALAKSAATLRDALRASGASRQLLTRAARWGIAPAPLEHEPLEALLRRAAAELDERLERVPAGIADLGSEELVTALSDLAAAGRLPVLPHLAPARVASLRAIGRPAAAGWLETVAAVRPRLRALDSHQLGRTPFAARANRPDLWQRNPTAAEVEANATRLELAFGPAAAFAGGKVAVSLLDRFVEVVPAANHATTAAAFGFNAPAARAPQTILLAVPPIVDRPLDTAMLVRIVGETRLLARAEDLDSLAAGLPSTLCPVARRGGVNLSTGIESWP
jgi:hypothetical protein